MNTQMVTIQVAPQVAAILQALQQQAEEQGVSLDTLLLPLVPFSEGVNGESEERLFYETATPEEWIRELYAWAESHDPNTPVILDDSREVIYGDDGR